MPIVANTFQSTSAVGNREELSDVVSRITPEDTPIYSMIAKGNADATYTEWETDVLATPGANIHLEGDEFDFEAVVPPVRVGNHTQIMRKDWIISGTQNDQVSNAGRIEKMKEQQLKRGVEIRKDAEFAILAPQASLGGATRQLGSLDSWLETNTDRGATGADGGFSAGVTVASTPGTQRAFTKTLLDSVHQATYTSGGNPMHAVVSPYVKSVFVTFMSDSNVASFRYAASEGTGNAIIATADVYEGPFGKLMITPNRVMATDATTARNVWLIEPSKLAFPWGRKIHNVPDLAKTGDAHKGVILGEGTLKVLNQAALGVVADVFGLTAAS